VKPQAPLLVYTLVTLTGAVSHFIKKRLMTDTDATMWQYFRKNLMWTLLSLAGSLFMFLDAYYSDTLSMMCAWTIGYAADSLLNRAPKSRKG
jgi:hypothetical protein